MGPNCLCSGPMRWLVTFVERTQRGHVTRRFSLFFGSLLSLFKKFNEELSNRKYLQMCMSTGPARLRDSQGKAEGTDSRRRLRKEGILWGATFSSYSLQARGKITQECWCKAARPHQSSWLQAEEVTLCHLNFLRGTKAGKKEQTVCRNSQDV